MRWGTLVLCCSLLAAGYLILQRSVPRIRCQRGVEPRCTVEPEPTPKDDPSWQACHKQHVEAITKAEEGEGYQLLFYGDSITETWAGTDHCLPCDRCKGVPEVLAQHFGKWQPGVMAIGGDQTAHLMWRLAHGECPREHQPRVVVVLIGTNDLGAAAWEAGDVRTAEEATMRAVPGMTLRVLRTLHMLRDLLPDTHVVLLALLPRGGYVPGASPYRWPSLFTQPLEVTNAHFREYTLGDPHLHFLDCGDRYLAPDGRSIDASLMPDALHPNAAGHELLAQCLQPLVTRLMQLPEGADGTGGKDGEVKAAASAASKGQQREGAQ